MQRLRDALRKAQEERAAIGHFNIADPVLLKAVFASAGELNVPVLVGASDGERGFYGYSRQLTALVQSLRDEHDFPIFINSDHGCLARANWISRRYSTERSKRPSRTLAGQISGLAFFRQVAGDHFLQ